jgi:hypothetical protein
MTNIIVLKCVLGQPRHFYEIHVNKMVLFWSGVLFASLYETKRTLFAVASIF